MDWAVGKTQKSDRERSKRMSLRCPTTAASRPGAGRDLASPSIVTLQRLNSCQTKTGSTMVRLM